MKKPTEPFQVACDSRGNRYNYINQPSQLYVQRIKRGHYVLYVWHGARPETCELIRYANYKAVERHHVPTAPVQADYAAGHMVRVNCNKRWVQLMFPGQPQKQRCAALQAKAKSPEIMARKTRALYAHFLK
jgi:hypothetical protein